MVDTHAHPDKASGLKPDALAYRYDDGHYVDLGSCRTDFEHAVLGAEDKLFTDIFDDYADYGEFEPELDDARGEMNGQVLSYIERIHCRQHRVFSFFLFMNAHYFRIIRADRDGLIVTEKRKWRQKQGKFQCLNEFLHRFDNLTPAQQGFDTTVCPVSPEHIEHAERARAEIKRVVPEAREDRAVLEMKVPANGEATGYRTFYIWVPTTEARGLRSRATRGYPAWDPMTQRIVFIKDYWRSDFPGVEREADVIMKLNAMGVEYAPTLICGGDIPNQSTVTHEHVSDATNAGQRRAHHPRRHHRIAENYGLPLWKFKSSEHLLRILLNSCACHHQAVVKCQKLHRDFSFRNILWDEETETGILTDWDLCAPTPTETDVKKNSSLNPLAQMPQSSGRPDRTGTWLFMSSLILQQKGKLHDVQDDLESLFWVGLYMILLYFPCGDVNVLSILDHIFYERVNGPEGEAVGGYRKSCFLRGDAGYPRTWEFPDPRCKPLADWVNMFRKMLKDWINFRSDIGVLYAELAVLERGMAAGQVVDEDDVTRVREDISNTRVPELRDYDALERKWKDLLDKGKEKGLFQGVDRLTDADHEREPEYVVALYRHRRDAAVRKSRQEQARAQAASFGQIGKKPAFNRRKRGSQQEQGSEEARASSAHSATLPTGSHEAETAELLEGGAEDEDESARPPKRRKPVDQQMQGRGGRD
ncbi:hypothetical protein HDZ31DRAFT_69731 [Schizophyllum fasciatum]